MGADSRNGAAELEVERSHHGPLYDSFSECGSREASRKGGVEGLRPAGGDGSIKGGRLMPLSSGGIAATDAAAAALDQLSSGPAGDFWDDGISSQRSAAEQQHDMAQAGITSGRPAFAHPLQQPSQKHRGGCGGNSHSGSHSAGGSRSLHSGMEFYRFQQEEQQAGLQQPWRPGGSVQAGRVYHPPAWRPEGSVSRRRGTQFYADIATRWKAAIASGDPRRVAELERKEAQLAQETAKEPEPEVPDIGVFFDFPETSGAGFSPRCSHAAAAVGDRLYVYGGLDTGDRALSDIKFFSVTTNMWRPVGPASGRKDAPPAMWGHAAAAAAGKIWIVGGHIGKKLQRKTFSLDTETLVWRALKEQPATPPAVADLTLTEVGEHGVLAFGGFGAKAASSTVYQLQPTTGTWGVLHTTGLAPSPRGGHTAVWDGEDRLIVFGGANPNNALAPPAVHVLSLLQRHWSQPACSGEGPGPRTRHCAAMLQGSNGGRSMAVFGGATSADALLNDVWLLDPGSWAWVRGAPLGASPTGRAGAACAVLAGTRIALCGGMSMAGPLDSLLLLSADFGPELSPLAEQVSRARRLPQPQVLPTVLQGGSGGSGNSVPVRAASVTESEMSGATAKTAPERMQNESNSGGGDVSGIAAVQLTELLRRRNVSEAAAEAGRRAELAERLFQAERQKCDALKAEVAHLRLLASEAEQAAADATAALHDETRRAQRDTGLIRNELAASQRQVEELRQQVQELQAIAADADRFREAAAAAAARERVAADAAVSARSQCASLQRRCTDLSSRLHSQRSAAAVAAIASAAPLRRTTPGAQQPPSPTYSSDGASSGSSSRDGGRSAGGGGSAIQRPPASPLGTRPPPSRLPSIGEGEEASASSSSDADSPSRLCQISRRGADASGSTAAAGGGGDRKGGLTVRTSAAAAAAADAVGETLETAFERWSMGDAATPPSGDGAAGAGGHASPPPPRRRSLDSSDAGGSSCSDAVMRAHLREVRGQLRQAMSALVAEREHAARLQAVMTARDQATNEKLAALERQLACLRGEEPALASCTTSELEDVERQAAAGATAARRAAAIAAAREAALESATCSLCMERPHNVVLGCGHQVCGQCSSNRCPTECPFCRTAITMRINVYKS